MHRRRLLSLLLAGLSSGLAAHAAGVPLPVVNAVEFPGLMNVPEATCRGALPQAGRGVHAGEAGRRP